MKDEQTEDTNIYTLYFDKQGCGPAPLQITLHTFPDLEPFDKPGGKGTLGLQFKPSGLTIIESPAGGGLYFSRRADVERLWREIGDWLEKHR